MTLKSIFFQAVFLIIFLNFSCKHEKFTPIVADISVTSLDNASKVNINTLWENAIPPILNRDLWTNDYMYDSGHFLMLPLHYAFYNKDLKKIQEISTHFDRFLSNYTYQANVELNDKAVLHYYYWASQYLSLSAKHNIKLSNSLKLAKFLESEIIAFWLERNAWHWSFNNFKGMKPRLEWKQYGQKRDNEYKFERFIFDDEKFLFAIAADLYYYNESQGIESNPVIKEIVDYAYTVFKIKVFDLPDGGWIFQPGVLDDHPDYAYTGYTEKKVFTIKNNVGFQAEDASHCLRYPLWLKSLAKAFERVDKDKYNYFTSLHIRLQQHFLKNVLVKPNISFPYYGTVNFIDGKNGLYIWKNIDEGETGYGPNELSFSILLGWWAFLNSAEIEDVYKKIDKNWSLAYFGHPNYKRIKPIYLNSPMLVLLTKIASNGKKLL